MNDNYSQLTHAIAHRVLHFNSFARPVNEYRVNEILFGGLGARRVLGVRFHGSIAHLHAHGRRNVGLWEEMVKLRRRTRLNLLTFGVSSPA